MKYLSDEMLNKYIDNELSEEENKIIDKILKSSFVDRGKYAELKKIDEGLKKMNSFKLSNNFTSNFMEKLRLKTIRDKKQKRFFSFLFLILVTVTLALSGTVLYETIAKNIGKAKEISLLKGLSFSTSFLTQNFGKFFSPDKLSLIGISLSLIFFISLYFLLEEIKKTKHRLKKIR